MGLAPEPHALQVLRSSEVILILRFSQPTLLTVAFAGFAAVSFGAKLLVMLIATVALKKLLAAKTFHQVGRTSNTHAPHTRSTVFARHAKKNQIEEGRKNIEEEWEENQENGRRRKPHFQTATFTPFSDWRSDWGQFLRFHGQW